MTETSATYTTCQKCKGEKHIFFERDGTQYAAECECLKWEIEQKRLHDLIRSARVPERYINKTLDSFIQFRQPEAHKIAKLYTSNWGAIRKQGRGIIFVGDVGTGKTHLSFSVFNELIRQNVSGLAVTVPDLMDDLRPRKGALSERQDEQIEALKTVDLLLLDDLGAQRNTAWVTERLFIIINARYNNMRPTIITSNNYLEDLDKEEGWPRIVDRISEMCRAIRMEGPSFRNEVRK